MPTKEQLETLRKYLELTVNIQTSNEQRTYNNNQYALIPRAYKTHILRTFAKEFQIPVYITSRGEVIFMKGPGKESLRTGKNCCPLDLRPVLKNGRNKREALKDMTAEALFEVFAILLNRCSAYRGVLVAVMCHLGFLRRKKKHLTSTIEIVVPTSTVLAEHFEQGQQVSSLYHHNYIVEDTYTHNWSLYLLDFPKEVWDILNNMFDLRGTALEGYSFEAYVMYLDQVLQNEDSKTAYQGKNGLTDQPSKKNPDYRVGRENTMRSALKYPVLSCGIMTSMDEIKKMDTMYVGMNPVPLYAIQEFSDGWVHFDPADVETDRVRYQKSIAKKDFLPDGVSTLTKKKTKAYQAVTANIDSRNGQCVILKGSIIEPAPRAKLTQEAENKRLLINYDATGLVLEDADLGECSCACVAQIIMGRKSAKWDTCDTRTDDPAEIFTPTNNDSLEDIAA